MSGDPFGREYPGPRVFEIEGRFTITDASDDVLADILSGAFGAIDTNGGWITELVIRSATSSHIIVAADQDN
jgi:hypothetical protein